MNLCEQRSQRVDQNIYAFTTEVRGQLATMDVQRLEVKSQVEGVAMRVDRVERDVEYLENKVPNQPHIEVEESVQEQQLRDAQLSLLKKKAKITKGTGEGDEGCVWCLGVFVCVYGCAWGRCVRVRYVCGGSGVYVCMWRGSLNQE